MIDYWTDVGFRAAVDEYIHRILLSVVADMCLGQADFQLSESHLRYLISIFDEGRNYPPLSPESKYSYKGVRRLLEKIKQTSSSELANDVMNLRLESRFGGIPSEHMSLISISKYRGLIYSRMAC